MKKNSNCWFKKLKFAVHMSGYLVVWVGLHWNPLYLAFGQQPATSDPVPSDDEEKLQILDDAQFPMTPLLGAFPDPRQNKTNENDMIKAPFKQIKWADIVKLMYEKDGFYYVQQNDLQLRLTLDPYLQKEASKILSSQNHISGAVSLIESRTGRILAMVERRGEKSPLLVNEDLITTATAPAASLMKIVTASGSIEKEGLNPSDQIFFSGGCGKLRNQNWLRNEKTDTQKLTLARAFGVSCNTAFSRLAIYALGLSALRHYTDLFYFNKPLKSDLHLETSLALHPSLETATSLEVAESGAGFGSSKISSIHAALLSAPAGNKGAMPVPKIVEEVINGKGVSIYKLVPETLSQVYSETTSQKMLYLMQETTLTGTSRKFFRRRQNSKLRFEMGGKTGTLSDAEERGTLYTWFSGIAPLESEQNISIGALVSSPKTHVVRASMIGQQILAAYLNKTQTISQKSK